MSLTQGRIERTGRVVFHDAAVSIWEEGIKSAREVGGTDGAQLWERQFKRDVFSRVVQAMNRIGWAVGPGLHIFTGSNARYCRKGDLHAELRLHGRHIEVKFFQNVNAPDRPDHDGRYQSDQERHMPYLCRMEMERTRRRIRDYLCNVFTGYVFEQPKLKRGSGVPAIKLIEQSYEGSWHFKGDLTNYTISESNSQSADGGLVKHGERVWFADYKGRIVGGTAYYNINNMWWVVTGRHDFANVASFEIYVSQPGCLRTKRNGKQRRQRLEKDLSIAVAAMKFERAAVLRDILFPSDMALFNVWNAKHQLFHRPNFCGYTSDQSKAGKFTADEVRGWNDTDNRVIPANANAKEAA